MAKMSVLSSRIKLPEVQNPSVEDVFSSGAEILYSNQYRNLHGDPGSEIVYDSPLFGKIRLRLADTVEKQDHFLFAHYLWNASLQLAELISLAAPLESEIADDGRNWSVKGEKVLEVGAGKSEIPSPCGFLIIV